jgi:hydrogenase nickel incorporation protein HypA/HybF
MHELSIASAIVDTAIPHARDRRVTLVTVRFGHLRQVVPDSVVSYWGFVTRDTVCDGSRLEIVAVPARLSCRACAHAWDVEIPAFRCPSCDSSDCAVDSGGELEVESLEVVEEKPAHA